MASTYVNDLRLNEMATGDESGNWGVVTNTNLELIGEALGYGTEGITTNANTHTTTVADGAADPGRAMYLEYTGTLDSACTITIAPNTVSRMHFIENGTSGSQNIIISQGSGANITIPPGDTKAVYLDGAGSGAAVVDAFASLNVVDLKVQDDLTVTDDVIIGGDIDLEGAIDVNGTANLDIVDIDGAVDMATTLAVAGNVDFNGDLDVDGTTNLDNTDIDGTLDVSGQATFADGSAGAPSISNTGDVNAGLFFSAADVMSFSAGGTAQFTMADGSISPVTDNDIDLGTASLKYKSFFAGLVDSENFKINGGQGDDGQVLTSTGSGVAWEAGGGGGVTFKEGGTNFTNSIMVGDDSTGTLDAATGNTGLGVDIFAALTTGDNNVAVGFNALEAMTTGHSTVAIGMNALFRTTTGVNSVGVGQEALQANTTGKHNVALGGFALVSNTTADANVAVGINVLQANTTGAQNVAVGGFSLDAATTASFNTAVGYGSLGGCTTGGYNTAIGDSAMGAAAHTGNFNTALGRSALRTITTGNSNTGVGLSAGDGITSGNSNVFVGESAGYSNTTGAENTFVGWHAGQSASDYSGGVNMTTGSHNTYIGMSCSGAANNSIGEVVLGRAIVGGGNNTFRVGVTYSSTNTATLPLNGSATTFTAASDVRLKENITDSSVGLNFINDLRPITYTWKARKDVPTDMSQYEENISTPCRGTGQTNYGFVAQEVKTIIDNHNLVDGQNIHRVDPDGTHELAPAELVPMLVKALQEADDKIDALVARVTTLEG